MDGYRVNQELGPIWEPSSRKSSINTGRLQRTNPPVQAGQLSVCRRLAPSRLFRFANLSTLPWSISLDSCGEEGIRNGDGHAGCRRGTSP